MIILQWNDPFGGSANDYDLYLVDPSESGIFAASVGFQNGIQDPVEAIAVINNGGSPAVAKIVVNKFSGANRRLEMFVLGGAFPTAVLEYNVPAGSVFGHPALPAVLATGAISACAPAHDADEPFT